MKLRKKIADQIKNGSGKFRRDLSGVAGIEFAFLAPILIIMTFGTFEVGRAVIVHKKLQRATDMVADLVAREPSLGADVAAVKGSLNGIMRAAEHSIWPYDNTKMKMRIMSVRAGMTPPNLTTLDWIYGYRNTPSVACRSQKNLPEAGMVVPGNAVVMVESEYQYNPIFNSAPIISSLVKPMTFTDTMVYTPRNTCVDVLNANCAQVCIPPMSGP